MEAKAGHCPICNSGMIEYMNGPDFSENEVWYEGYCEDCETEFQEIYEITYTKSEILKVHVDKANEILKKKGVTDGRE